MKKIKAVALFSTAILATASTGVQQMDIKSDVLASDSATGYSAMKLTAGRGIYLKFDDYKITGKYRVFG